MSWPKTADQAYYLFEGRVLIPIDPSTGVAQMMLRPQGGMGVGIPAIATGDPGDTPVISDVINLTELDYDDITAASASFTEISPNTYQLNLSLHKGAPGDAGSNATVLDADDVSGTPTYKDILTVNSTADGVEFTTQKVGDRYIPATISSVAAGNPTATLCTVTVPAQDFDWRPRVHGHCLVTGTGADVQVDLVARLDNAASGNVIGRGISRAGQTPPPIILTPGPPAGSVDGYDKVLAGNAATIYLRAERQTGTDTFTTSASTTLFSVEVNPVP